MTQRTKETAEHIADQAKESAAELLRAGWTAKGCEYSIGSFHGDAEALEASRRLGRGPNREDLRALEEAIRMRLDEGRPVRGAAR